ncbi:MAG: hypothetical protein HC882_02900, partial [Acidobacteria bacterium]|nr:hypothetical protein [Acidobacteriota bacterium]
TDVQLTGVPSALYTAGHIQADEGLVVCRCINTDDGRFIKVVDVREATPMVTSFAVNPPVAGSGLDVDQVAIDEWMGASPVYTGRMRRLMRIEGDTVPAIVKALDANPLRDIAAGTA